ILYSGSFGEQEDIAKLVEALGLLKRQKIAFRMRFLGADPALPGVSAMHTLVQKLDLGTFVEAKGFCVAEVVRQEVAQANILVNLRTNSIWSRSGLSTKLSEYLAAGRTVLTTDIGDNARYVEDRKSALVVSVEDSAERVAAVLREALENRDLRRRLGEGARAAALKHFDVPVVQRTIQEGMSELSRG
ncbi:MAG TPA: glycosyltransferase family 4 protein, partial [Verrucomicrobiae bacterium]|nr:glycosyltransferase family 4 protein [Verrucomicrobiae bacterium]